MRETNIFANKERQNILRMYQISYKVNGNLDLLFYNETDEMKAIKLFKEHNV